MNINSKVYGTLTNGKEVKQFTLKNKQGIEVRILEYGGIFTHIFTPDMNGEFSDIVLGLEDLESYLEGHPYFGAIVGRYGNRICEGKFRIGPNEYQLSINDGPHHLHGGTNGLDKKLWKGKIIEGEDQSFLRLHCTSAAGEEGYPGNIAIQVDYKLTEDNKLQIEYLATTDAPTHINLTHHSYFNLSGNPNNTILDHQVELNADSFIPVDESLIPTGEIRSVKNSAFDFRNSKPITKDINSHDAQIIRGRGYDHCWIINEENNNLLTKAARVYHPLSRRQLEVYTTEPGIQFYTGNFLDGSLIGKNNTSYNHRCGFCLETQHFPDSPNQPDFPSTLLLPNKTYNSTTIYKFAISKEV